MKKFIVWTISIIILVFLIINLIHLLNNDDGPLLESNQLQTISVDGKTYGLFDDGNVYSLNSATGNWEFIEVVYEPGFFEKNYEIIDEEIYVISQSSGKRYLVKKYFEENFEKVSSVRDLIGPERGWNHFQIISPITKTDKKANELRDCILLEECDFKDNRIDVDSEIVYSGEKSMKFFAVSPTRDMVTSKASLRTGIMYFVKGDDLWFSGWYYVEEGMPFTIADFESSYFKSGNGPRIFISGKYVAVELKWADKPTYRQKLGQEIKFPKNKWTNIKIHLKLSETEDGIIEVWQDNIKIIDTKGRTLPTSNTILNRLEVGISATDKQTTLYVDDIVISDKPL